MIKIAMVEDDTELAEILTQYLLPYEIEVTNYEDPFIALNSISMIKYDLIILDLTLPGLDGLEVCKDLVNKYDIPIIISSARSDISDKVNALEIGADDYLPKPYDPRELEIRIKTLLRRYNKIKIDSTADVPKKIFEVNIEKQEIKKDGEYLKFTNGEFQIFSLLYSREGFIVSRYDILENCDFLNSDEDGGSIAVIINRIRTKIEDNPKQPQYLVTIRGMGYKFIND